VSNSNLKENYCNLFYSKIHDVLNPKMYITSRDLLREEVESLRIKSNLPSIQKNLKFRIICYKYL